MSQFANLTAEQLSQINTLQDSLGVVLIAYENQN